MLPSPRGTTPTPLWRDFTQRLTQLSLNFEDIKFCDPADGRELLQELGFTTIERAKIQTEWKRRLTDSEACSYDGLKPSIAANMFGSHRCFVLCDPYEPDMPIVFCSEEFMQMTGFTREEIIGRNCRFLQGPGTEPDVRRAIKQALANGQDITVNMTNYKKDGTPFVNRLTISQLRAADQHIAFYVGVSYELTQKEVAALLENVQNWERSLAPNEPANYEQLWNKYQEISREDAETLRRAGVLTAADFFEYCCDRNPHFLAVEAVDRPKKYTYHELDLEANRVANWGLSIGLSQGETVCLMLENRPEFLAITMGLAKIGVTVALINTNSTGSFLLHAVRIAHAKAFIISDQFRDFWNDCRGTYTIQVWVFDQTTLDTATSFEQAVRQCPDTRPDRSLRSRISDRDALYYIYTSGTTGPSKAAKFSHRRFIGAALTWTKPCQLTPRDRYYIFLPLYHGNAGVVAVAPCYFSGCSIVLRTKFSASNFLPDIRHFGCTATIYIGEIWNFLNVLPEKATDHDNPLRVIVGNGLRAELWEPTLKRFGIQRVVEHYGATEMPGSAMLNYFNRVGSCGFVPPSVRTARAEDLTLAYDVEHDAVLRVDPTTGELIPDIPENADRTKGLLCKVAAPGEPGEVVMKLDQGIYDGYVRQEGFPDFTQQKLLHNVVEQGDTWWLSGDILRIDADGFAYFVDRAGDTFRWKGENVSTYEVEKALRGFPGILEVNAYGVRFFNYGGKAGMVCISHKRGHPIDVSGFYKFVEDSGLPHYAKPLVIRVTDKENEKTATYKFRKVKYTTEGFNPEIITYDKLYYWSKADKDYIPLTTDLYSKLESGDPKYRPP
eukprot:TRINITY_DN67049_c0_g1_i1.p1 TRINITY_DN67049_c0_g1~~TRINITY_DN67049_c0_g1_i1.p1  ORF type:complete len:843 (-),score=120.38 TRINITY_DN67049_c0_g1_i1:131-2638(-)